MNILQICSAREIGGGERHLIDLAKGLALRGHNVYVAGVPNSPLIKQLSTMPFLELPLRNSFDIYSSMKLARYAHEMSIDIIHAHVGRDFPIAAFASRLAGNVPYVLTRHVLFSMKRLHRKILSRVSRVIAVSDAVANSLRNEEIFDHAKIVAIPNGIDVERFTRRTNRNDASSTDDQFVVGMVGHLSPIKGQQEFVHAASIISSMRNDVQFVIVGEDKSRDGRNRAGIERLIAELGLADRVRLAGWVDDVRGVLETFDIFVSPSREEPFGLAIAEAMSLGVPVVATMSEGAREIVVDGITGRLVPLGDLAGIASAVSELLADAAERDNLSKMGSAAVRERFSLEQMIDATERVYLEEAKRRPATALSI